MASQNPRPPLWHGHPRMGRSSPWVPPDTWTGSPGKGRPFLSLDTTKASLRTALTTGQRGLRCAASRGSEHWPLSHIPFSGRFLKSNGSGRLTPGKCKTSAWQAKSVNIADYDPHQIISHGSPFVFLSSKKHHLKTQQQKPWSHSIWFTKTKK